MFNILEGKELGIWQPQTSYEGLRKGCATGNGKERIDLDTIYI